jgi:ubiquinone/menaquinone biosynthesis C-methylase UbiE
VETPAGGGEGVGHMRDNRSYYDEFSAWYEKERHHGYHALIDDLETELIQPFAYGRDVLEVGCGTGLILRRVAPWARRAVGVDISPGMLEQARARGLEVVEGSADALPFEAGAFDLLYSFKVLAHVKEIQKALQEFARVTRPGATLVLEFYNRRSLRYLARRAGGAKAISAKTRESAVYTRWDTLEELTAMLPSELSLERVAGVRVLTPAAAAHRVPLLRGALAIGERVARDSQRLAPLGGFLVLILKRR